VRRIFLTFLAGASIFATEFAMADEAQDANQEVILCMYKAALQFDDSVSDVSSIAPAVADSCKEQSNRFYQILRRGVSGPVDEEKIRNAIRQRDLDTARMVILQKRADDRKSRK